MNVLILGGNGYLGSKITRRLIEDGHSAVCTKRAASNLSRLEDIKDKIIWIPASMDGVESAMQYMTFDYVLNMACNYGRSNVLYNDIIDANIEFPLKVLNTVADYGIKKYLTIGTGLPDELDMYSFSKKMFSEFGRFYADKHEITFNTLLLEMFYGMDEPQNRFFPSVISKMLAGDDVEITAGTQRRDIICSEDIVKAVMMVVESDLKGYHEVPVGTGESPTIGEIVDYIWELTGKKSEVHKGAIPMRKDEPDCVADTTVLKSLGEWNPKPWKEGLFCMIKNMNYFLGGGIVFRDSKPFRTAYCCKRRHAA